MSTVAVSRSVLSCSDCVQFATPGNHKWLAGVVFLAVVVGVVALIALGQAARSSSGTKRWGLVLVMASVVLVCLSAALVLLSVESPALAAAGGDSVQCGRPLLSRSDLDVAATPTTVSTAAAYCRREFAHRRTWALATLVSALAAAVGAAFLLVALRSGHGRARPERSSEPDPVGST